MMVIMRLTWEDCFDEDVVEFCGGGVPFIKGVGPNSPPPHTPHSPHVAVTTARWSLVARVSRQVTLCVRGPSLAGALPNGAQLAIVDVQLTLANFTHATICAVREKKSSFIQFERC